MQIVTDSGTDVYLSPQERDELNIHVVPLVVTLDGKSYQEGVNITPGEFYPLLEASGNLPTTSYSFQSVPTLPDILLPQQYALAT